MEQLKTLGLIAGVLVYGVTQLGAAYLGIEHHIGHFWGWAAVFVALAFRFTLPAVVGSFYGATDVWGWHWAIALAFASPGLALMLPGIAVGLFGEIGKRWRRPE